MTHARRRHTPRKSNKCIPKCKNSAACMHGGRRHTTRNSHKCISKSSNSTNNKLEQVNTKCNNSTACVHAGIRQKPRHSHICTPNATTLRPGRKQEGVTRQETLPDAHRMQQLHDLHARRRALREKKAAQMHTDCNNTLACTHAGKQHTPRH